MLQPNNQYLVLSKTSLVQWRAAVLQHGWTRGSSSGNFSQSRIQSFLPLLWRRSESSSANGGIEGDVVEFGGKRDLRRFLRRFSYGKTGKRVNFPPRAPRKTSPTEGAMRCEWAMPCRNGQVVFKRKHGVCLPKFGLFSSLLFALCCLEARSGVAADGRACSPCPGNCSCSAVGPQNSCVVNCSSIGLDQAPAASDLPSDTHTL